MPLAKVSDILKSAQEANTAVYAFDCLDLNTITAAVRGAELARKPIIIMLYPAMRVVCPLRVFAEMVKTVARTASVPVGLHLDHCSDFDLILEAIREGFTSVMADGSLLPLAENIAFTRSVVRVAKIFDADVEGELGHVGSADTAADFSDEEAYTTAEEARLFSEQTEVTSLAVAFGSAHGVYVKQPKLSIARLKEIDTATATPLVLHGGSGIPEDQLVEAFANGVNKFNVGTEFFLLNSKLTREAIEKADPKKPFSDTEYIRKGLTDYVAQKISLCKMQV